MKIYSSLVEVLLALPDTIKTLNPDLIVEYDYSSSSNTPIELHANITILDDSNASLPTHIKLCFDIHKSTFRVNTVAIDAHWYVHSSSQLEFFAKELMQIYPIPNNRKESLSITNLTIGEKHSIMEILEELELNLNKIKVT